MNGGINALVPLPTKMFLASRTPTSCLNRAFDNDKVSGIHLQNLGERLQELVFGVWLGEEGLRAALQHFGFTLGRA
jgi:hypothetical protein